MSFFSEDPLYFPSDEWITFEFDSQKYPVKLRGKVVRVTASENGWLYGVTIEEPVGMDKRSYFQIVYDRNNQYLPKSHDVWMTPFDGLIKNVVERLSFKKVITHPIYKTPSLPINESIQLSKNEWILKDFRFEQLTIRSREDLQKKEQFLLPYKNLDFKLRLNTFDKNLNEYVYDVDNILELMEEEQFQVIVKEWSKKAC